MMCLAYLRLLLLCCVVSECDVVSDSSLSVCSLSCGRSYKSVQHALV